MSFVQNCTYILSHTRILDDLVHFDWLEGRCKEVFTIRAIHVRPTNVELCTYIYLSLYVYILY